ncbi:MAG: hypothetical protein Q4B80_01910 [Aerococcaceae bacterium]|nr:hypothetical protein [Aerococcaceae bacterium]
MERAVVEHLLHHGEYAFIQRYYPQNSLVQRYSTLALAVLGGNQTAFEQHAPQDALKASPNERKLYHYYHYLTLQLRKKEYADYLRGLTPLLVDVFCLLIEHHFLPELMQYVVPITKETVYKTQLYRGRQWDKARIEADDNAILRAWQHYYPRGFDYAQYISSSHLIKLLEFLGKKSPAYTQAFELRQIEKLARNLVAHEVVPVDEPFIVERVGKTPQQIHALLQQTLQTAGLNDTKQWQFLTHLNHLILEQIFQ